MTDERVPGSPAWLPRFEDGSFARFTNDGSRLEWQGAKWGPMRIVYLQHPSDPIVFFSMRYLYARPEWLDEPRGGDVSPDLLWFPLITAWQLAVDMAVSDQVPPGHGHAYSYVDHINSWIEVTQPEGWTQDGLERLRGVLLKRQNS